MARGGLRAGAGDGEPPADRPCPRGRAVGLPGTIAEAAAALRTGRATSELLTAGFLDRARRANPELGAFVTLCAEQALDAAAAADADLAAGRDRGPLQGVPVAVKDVLATADAPTTAQSRALAPGWFGGRDAAVVAALRDAGAVIVGKTSLSEFAIGLPEPDDPFPPPRNPWRLDRWAGGSSAGTAAGLAAELFLGGLGTDTGGSVRIPAAFSGVTGLRPSPGLVPREGCVPLAPSLDEIGPMARSASDCALLLEAIATGGAAQGGSPGSQLGRGLEGATVGVDRRHYREARGVDGAAAAAFEAALGVLESGGASIRELTIPGLDVLAAATSVVLLSEALDCHRRNLGERWADYGRWTRLRLATGCFYSGADLVRATSVLRAGRDGIAAALEPVDVLIALTAGTVAFPLADLGPAVLANAPLFTLPWSGLGLPALSLPIGFDPAGLPLGMQIVGRPSGDATVLRVGEAYQALTDWHLRRSPLAASLDDAT